MAIEPESEPKTRKSPGRWRMVAQVLALCASVYLLVRFFVGGDRDLAQIRDTIRPEILVTGVAVYLGFMALRTMRLRLLLGEHAPSWRDLFVIQAISYALGAVSPGRIAEATKIEMLRRDHRVPLDRALMSFGVEKTQDLGFYGVATLATVWVVGNLDFIPEGWVKDSFLPLVIVLVLIAAGLVVYDLGRRRQSLRDLLVILASSAAVFAGTYVLCYVVFWFHGIPDPWTTLAVNSLTVMAGALSGLPGGGQGVVQYAFDFTARRLFGIDAAVAYSMVLHITLNFYLGTAASVLTAILLRPSRR